MGCRNERLNACPIRRLPLRVALLAMLAALAGCKAVGPDYARPAAETPAIYKEAGDWQPAQPRDHLSRGKWWDIYADARLDALMEQVNVSNQTLISVQARFRQAVALVQVARAALFPTVTGSLSATRSRAAGGGSAGQRTAYSLPLNLDWEVDLWGRIARNVEANVAATQASAADIENVRLSLHAQLAQAYFQLRATDAQRKLFENTIEAFGKSLELTRNRYAAGVVARSDLAQAEAQLKSTEAQALDLGIARAQLEHAIALLIGKPPASLTIPVAPLTAAPPPIPPGLPAELLERRPDIAAAERRVAEANAQIGVAQAAFFPALTLGATLGFQSATAAHLLSLPNRFWSVGPALAMTLFDAGRRRALSDQAVAGYDVSVADYRDTVLNGFKEVEDALVELRILEQEAKVQAEAVKAAEDSLRVSLNQYRAGITTYLQVVTAQATLLASQRSAEDIGSRRMVASVQLVRALGGGWDAAALPPADSLSRRSGK